MAEISKFARTINDVAPLSTARSAAGIPLSANFNLNGQMPLDDRQVASSLEERDAIPDIRRYDGLVVYVADGQGLSYQLVGGITNEHWKKYGTSDASDVTGLHAVATSGDYNDLENTPTKVSEFENDAAFITLNDIPNSTQLGGEEPTDAHTNLWFDTSVETSDEVILNQESGVFVQSPSGIHYKVVVSETGQLSTERVELEPSLVATIDTVVLRSALNVEFVLGVTDDGHLTTQML